MTRIYLEGVYGRHQPKIPLSLSKKSGQAGVNEEDNEKDRVNNGKAGEELGEGGDDIVPGKDEAGQDVGDDTENTNPSQTVTLGICIC